VLEMLPYKKDEARIENQETAKGLHRALIKAYKQAGHEIVKVPIMPVSERADFVIKHIDTT
jgi:predicted ATPase